MTGRATNEKNVYCHTCKRWFHHMGIARHRLAHRDRREDCKVTYTNGDTYVFKYSEKK